MPTAKLFILTGPSGVGKSTLIDQLIKRNVRVQYLITHTTRAPRSYEIDGVHYFFITQEEYDDKKAQTGWLTAMTYHGNSYGICKKYLQQTLQGNQNLISCITPEVITQLQSFLPEQIVTIFVAPPSMEELKRRLFSRNDNPEILQARFASATDELKLQNNFDYKIVNDSLELAVEKLKNIIEKHGSLC